MHNNNPETGYQPGHPWFYKLDGKVLYPKEILENVEASGYKGYRQEDIEQEASKPEPHRSVALRKLRQEFLNSLKDNLREYRRYTLELQLMRTEKMYDNSSICSDIHVSMSLKHNHIYNDLAHLNLIDALLSEQPDLFFTLL